MKKSIDIDTVAIEIPFLNVTFKISDNLEKEIVTETLIRSEDKRFLTSWQCCANCTENAIKSVLEYRKFLVDQKVKLSKIKNSQFNSIINYVLDQVKKFLSVSERHDIIKDQKYLSQQLEILRNNILNIFYRFCNDAKIEYPKQLFAMIKK
ncbi:MAG: hypothetical protein PHI97_23045 [Desulfobulbus sp.]|nr:hypothetical protein [Desulfobulbus sp.]